MKFASRPRNRPLLRFSCIALASLILSGQASPTAPQRFSFPFKNTSDLRGILNVFSAFRRACLDQPVTRDLPASLVPDDYRIVSFKSHLFGKDESGVQNTAILSKTGLEESDFAGGHPIINFTMPDDKRPNGHCSVVWKRGWDYADEHVPKIMRDTAVRLDAHVSFRLEAILRSTPDAVFQPSERYGLYSEWATPCRGESVCSFSVTAVLDREKGIEMKLSRKGLLQEEAKGQK